ncbi:YuzD family protein [Fervidibacillus halotolerans]|uniref:YuzD family protein n=1 Tax=Fervidibacillus halotolerans TaxID=2980027 RepID=A0A9E8LY63_9BACI|nr:YuzD family protein [Fervidibacillus halotolerans]WAA11890.1 YuzD family protein [Fervidibacillus halotolerans]
MHKPVEITVYGAEQICASCVHSPSSKDTYEWLQAALKRKYPNQPFSINYVDIFQPPEDKKKKEYARKIIEEDLVYPVITIEDHWVAEGNPHLKKICSEMEKYGYRSQ